MSTHPHDGLAHPNLVITGAWRSGTTLLFLLFPHAFEDVVTSGEESDALDTWLPSTARWRVSKRPNDIHLVRRITQELDPWFVHLVRDPRDCIVSWREHRGDYWFGFPEWLRNHLFAESARTAKLVRVRYEDLVRTPDRLQAELCSRVDGLVARAPMSSCATLVDEGSPIAHQLRRGVRHGMGAAARPFDHEGIGAWRSDLERVRTQLAAHPELQAVLEWYGYEDDDSWQEELDR